MGKKKRKQQNNTNAREHKTINDKTRQQEGRQDKTCLKKKPNTITLQENTTRQSITRKDNKRGKTWEDVTDFL